MEHKKYVYFKQSNLNHPFFKYILKISIDKYVKSVMRQNFIEETIGVPEIIYKRILKMVANFHDIEESELWERWEKMRND